jgi:signal transduction histidine kinase
MLYRLLSKGLSNTFGIRVDDEIDDMVVFAKQNQFEEYIRHAFLLTLSLMGVYHLMILFPIVWFTAYTCASLMTRIFLHRLPKSPTPATYLKVALSVGLRLLIFRLMILAMWFYPHPAAQYVAMFMLMAALGFTVNFKSRIRSYMLMQMAIDVLVIVVIASQFLFFSPDFEGALIVGLSGVFLAIYLCVTIKEHFSYLDRLADAEEQHRQALKMEAIGRLTGGVAHDFNNILTVVLGNLELHEELEDRAEQRILIAKTRDAAERAADLTAQLLAFSRKSTLSIDIHRMEEIFARIIAMTDRLLPASFTLKHSIAEDTRPLRVDGTQLEVAILNLILNARDAMKDGGEITLRAENYVRNQACTLPAKNYVAIILNDKGGGIPDDILDRVTEPFFTTKPVGEGSGLGLSMVKGFVEQIGGGMHIATDPGTSTTITLCIPAIDRETENPAQNTT